MTEMLEAKVKFVEEMNHCFRYSLWIERARLDVSLTASAPDHLVDLKQVPRRSCDPEETLKICNVCGPLKTDMPEVNESGESPRMYESCS